MHEGYSSMYSFQQLIFDRLQSKGDVHLSSAVSQNREIEFLNFSQKTEMMLAGSGCVGSSGCEFSQS